MNNQRIAGGNELLNPEHLLKNILKIAYQSKVADLGCGSMGFFTLQAAKLIGDKGTVYAVDILREVLSSIESRSRQEGLYNIKTIWSNLEIVGATKIPQESLDYTILVNTLFQTQKHREVLAESFNLLKAGGRLLVVEWKTSGGPIGPTQEMRISLEEVKQLSIELGFKIEREFVAGDNHYGIIFIK
ncbi:class I SAM-dependent methyltransferase [Patescibacteria group bacterium]|nr:class I SAM-dependent methyltransferase [Patescibacteria group bacterium]